MHPGAPWEGGGTAGWLAACLEAFRPRFYAWLGMTGLLSSDNFSFSFKILSNEDPFPYLTGLFKH